MRNVETGREVGDLAVIEKLVHYVSEEIRDELAARHDLPAGGRRLVQKVDGYKATFVSGVPVFENGAHTGAQKTSTCCPGSSNESPGW